MRRHTHFLVVKKVMGNTATNEGVYIEFETPSSKKKMILLKRQEIFPDFCQCLSLNDAIYVGFYT